MYVNDRIAGIICDHNAKNPQNANLKAVIIAAQNVPFWKIRKNNEKNKYYKTFFRNYELWLIIAMKQVVGQTRNNNLIENEMFC